MGVLSLLAVSPAMAKDFFSVGVSFGRACSYTPPVVVHRPIYVPPVVVARYPVVVEKRCPTVIVTQPRMRVTYVAPARHWNKPCDVRPHGTK